MKILTLLTFLSLFFLTNTFAAEGYDIRIDAVGGDCGPGTGCVDEEGGLTFACATTIGNFLVNNLEFNDPLQAGENVENISFSIQLACDATDITLYLNGDPIGPTMTWGGDPCSWLCEMDPVVFSTSDLPNYNYGGINTLTFDLNDNPCIYFIDVELECTVASPIPTISEWGLILMGLVLLSLGLIYIRKPVLAVKN